MAGPSATATEPLMQPPPSMSYLQIDFILAEILPKLPAKSLLRFKTVCKSFHNTISSPEFSRLHLRQSLSSDNSFLYMATTYRTLCSLDLKPLSSTVPSATFRWHEGSISVVGSCNGLLLLSHYQDYILPLILLNPSTRTYIDIKSPSKRSEKGLIGIGFDHLTDDYKIIWVCDDYAAGIETRNTSIYSVNSKSWKEAQQTYRCDLMNGWHGGVLVNNNLLHWMFRIPTQCKRRIFCFDVCSEKWKDDDVLLPPYYYDPTHQNYLLDIGILDGLLFSSFENGVDSCYDIWVMREYTTDGQSWTKLFSIKMSADLDLHGGVVPVAYRSEGSSEVLLRQRHKARLLWYDKEDNEINNVEAPRFWGGQPHICNGSLVSLPDAIQFGSTYIRRSRPGC